MRGKFSKMLHEYDQLEDVIPTSIRLNAVDGIGLFEDIECAC